MEWLIRFIAVWIIFVVLIDWKELKVNIWCGLLSVCLQLAVDSFLISNGFYKIQNPIISIWGSSVFFVFGPVVVVSVLISQFMPEKRWARIVNIIALTTIYSCEELLLVLRKALIYTNWHLVYSIAVNAIIMITLSWFSMVVLKRGGTRI